MKLLAPFGILYGRIVDLRNLLYDRGLLKSHDLGVRTISVGNLTAGGTGKTPLVALIAKILVSEGRTVCILTRGYGRRNPNRRVLVSDGASVLAGADEGGDEPVELALQLEGKAIIVADPDRVAAAKWAREKFNISTFILDDGFQHRRARRDLDIVCVDSTNPCGNGRILPAGTLRESFKGLKRADAIVITRTELVETNDDLEARLRNRNPKARIFRARTELEGFVALGDLPTRAKSIETPRGKVFAFTAIGNSENFIRTLSESGLELAGHAAFRDHHRFTQGDVHQIESEAIKSGGSALVTTVKDAVKLTGLGINLPCNLAVTHTAIADSEAFRRFILDEVG